MGDNFISQFYLTIQGDFFFYLKDYLWNGRLLYLFFLENGQFYINSEENKNYHDIFVFILYPADCQSWQWIMEPISPVIYELIIEISWKWFCSHLDLYKAIRS